MAKKISQPTLLAVTSVAPFDVADSAAIQALSYGNATPDQQQRALKWIILKACDFHGMSFRESDRDTAFAEGKRFVAQQLNVLLTHNIRNMFND